MKKTVAIIGIIVASATAWSQSAAVVYDPTVASLIVQTHNIQYQLSYWKGELMVKQLAETQKMSQNIERMTTSIEEQTRIMGDPAKVGIGMSVTTPPSLNVKTVEDILEDTRKNPATIKGADQKTVSMLQERKLAVDHVIKLQMDNGAQRGNLINQLDGAVMRLKDAKTDAEVQKINGEINAIQTAILALEHEMKDQDRTYQYVQANQEEEQMRKIVTEEQNKMKNEAKDAKKQAENIKKYAEKLKNNPDDTDNPLNIRAAELKLRNLRRAMAEKAKKGDWSADGSLNKHLSTTKKTTEFKKVPLSQLGYSKNTTDQQLERLTKEYLELKIIIIDDRKEAEETETKE